MGHLDPVPCHLEAVQWGMICDVVPGGPGEIDVFGASRASLTEVDDLDRHGLAAVVDLGHLSAVGVGGCTGHTVPGRSSPHARGNGGHIVSVRRLVCLSASQATVHSSNVVDCHVDVGEGARDDAASRRRGRRSAIDWGSA
jgi:hypothetical protein